MVAQPSGTGQVTSVELSADLRERLDELARLVGRPRDDLIVDALRYYVDSGMRYIAEIEEARADVRAGRTYSLEEVAAHLRERGYVREAVDA